KGEYQMRTHLVHRLVSAGLLVTVVLAWLTHDQLTTNAIAAWVAHSGVWRPVVFISSDMITPALFFPGSVLTLAGGTLFWLFAGGLVSVIGATIGATVAFLNDAFGLTRLSVQTLAVTSFVTMAPGAFAYAYLGDVSHEAVSGGPELVRKGLLAL